MQANYALHAYKPLLPAVKTGQPHGLIGGKSSNFLLYPQKREAFLYELRESDNKAGRCAYQPIAKRADTYLQEAIGSAHSSPTRKGVVPIG